MKGAAPRGSPELGGISLSERTQSVSDGVDLSNCPKQLRGLFVWGKEVGHEIQRGDSHTPAILVPVLGRKIFRLESGLATDSK